MSSSFDPRVRMRDALRTIVTDPRGAWDQPSLLVLRNRLLDETGSDARPLAELLLEALRRGWRDRLPLQPVDAPRWDALVAPFILQWSAERFVQPEMARWAVECWGFALGAIDASMLRVAPPVRPESMTSLAARLNARAAATGAQATRVVNGTLAWRGKPAGAAGGRGASGVRSGGAPSVPSAGAPRPRQGIKVRGSTSGTPSRAPGAYAPQSRVPARVLNPLIPRVLFASLVLMASALVVRVAVAGSAAPASVAATPAPAPVTRASARADSLTRPPATTAERVPTASARLVSPALTGGVSVVATERPGVPALTQSLLPTRDDSARMLWVQPARRAAGESRRLPGQTPVSALVYDELHLTDGSIMRGRVDVVRAGTVVFRDQRTGLRHEVPKDDITQLITEFGNTVRFRGGAAPPVAAPRGRGVPAAAGVRDRGVSGRYLVRYTTSKAVGSPECTSQWSRPPKASDIAIVQHRPGADTLVVAFEGGDAFPSTIDADGYFASTFRIVPDQARMMTALTTRLSGRFREGGLLDLTVNIVFYRRLRGDGAITCNIAVDATGMRSDR